MTGARPEGVVVDTMVISWLSDERASSVAERYRELIGASPVVLAFQTVMELRYGALRAGWVSCGSADSNGGSPNWWSSSPTTR